jgi:hypothetical protein
VAIPSILRFEMDAIPRYRRTPWFAGESGRDGDLVLSFGHDLIFGALACLRENARGYVPINAW